MAIKVVLGVIGADCHAVGNRIIERVLGDAGLEVQNLGVMVSQEEFVLAAKDMDADAILVSSLYGHGEIDCQGLREFCDDEGIGDVLLYVGGNLVVGKLSQDEIERRFIAMGYDRVFAPSVDLADVVSLLNRDVMVRQNTMIGHNSRAAMAHMAA